MQMNKVLLECSFVYTLSVAAFQLQGSTEYTTEIKCPADPQGLPTGSFQIKLADFCHTGRRTLFPGGVFLLEKCMSPGMALVTCKKVGLTLDDRVFG